MKPVLSLVRNSATVNGKKLTWERPPIRATKGFLHLCLSLVSRIQILEQIHLLGTLYFLCYSTVNNICLLISLVLKEKSERA